MEFIPFWRKEIIEREAVMFVEKDGKRTGRLAFSPKRILSVTDGDGNEYEVGRDFYLDGDEVVSLRNQHKYVREEWLFNKNVPDYIETESERWGFKSCMLMSPPYMYDTFYFVTYERGEVRNMPEPVAQDICLPLTYERLKKGKLHLAFYGDSISNAANSSWEMKKPNPELTWREQAKRNIEAQFQAEVVLHNYSRSGYGADWGREAVEEKFTGEETHLVLIAFGMNDGSANVPPKRFEENLKAIMEKIQATVKNSDGKGVEFILISTPLPNPDSTEVARLQPLYADVAQSLVKSGVVHINMTAVWQWLLTKKKYCEISGNNINHPNDFGYRFYGDGLGETFRLLKKQNEMRLNWSQYTDAPEVEEVSLDGLPENVRAVYLPIEADGVTTKTFAFVGVPKTENPAPALVLVHGGGGYAYLDWVESCMKRGYAAISLDVSATQFEKDIHTKTANPYSGGVKLSSIRETDKQPKNTWTYKSVASILTAQAYMRSLPQVDKENIGLVGISWGGVLSLIALKNAPTPFTAGVIVYSAGYITEDLLGLESGVFTRRNAKETYDFQFDPRNYVGDISPVLFHAGLIDGAFSAVSRTRLTRLLNGDVEHAYLSDLLHDNASNFESETVFSYMDEKLKKQGKRLRLSDEDIVDGEFVCRYENETPIRAELIWSSDTKGMSKFWVWNTVPATLEDGKINAKIPEDAKRVVLTAYKENGLYASTEMKEVF